ncbi:MAG: VanW family protein [Armatimonadetes bacterium]|nr:VanW family protein [Armatimonadota bacterium]MDE2207724.1 VanW family protein [Armatimonadota bacterium]
MQETAGTGSPTRFSAALFRARALCLQCLRILADGRAGIRAWPAQPQDGFPHLLAESRTPLWSDTTVQERDLQQGKVQNLRCALRRLNGAAVPAGATFSFWKQIGRATPARGYTQGRQLREGCLYPAIGGGLCQLSNALYCVALDAGFEIVERHAHGAIIPGSAAEVGRDATVAWNYIDLRFRPAQPVRLQAEMTRAELVVRAWGQAPARAVRKSSIAILPLRPRIDVVAHSCPTCGVDSCFRHREYEHSHRSPGPSGARVWIMDERWPEFEQYVTDFRTDQDVLAIPLDGARWNRPRHAWNTAGFAAVRAASLQSLVRSWQTRRLSRYGAARLTAQLKGAERLATTLAGSLAPHNTDVTVAQSLLPFLWRDGHLGGRSFQVLMTRMPLASLHAKLDGAMALNPERKTLGEFRAPAWMVDAETAALRAAQHIITPHAAVAALFPGQALRLPWRLPSAVRFEPGNAVLFPGPTAARKGAFELREAARSLDLEIVLCGVELEGETFWEGCRTRRVVRGAAGWLNGVGLVVQPALVEDAPRALLAAAAAGLPIVATEECGLHGVDGVTELEFGDAAALTELLRHVRSAAEISPASKRDIQSLKRE